MAGGTTHTAAAQAAADLLCPLAPPPLWMLPPLRGMRLRALLCFAQTWMAGRTAETSASNLPLSGGTSASSGGAVAAAGAACGLQAGEGLPG
mmetsp:Transcript_31888/g.95225  ORF Transcript_31888/g.95225 Transcript_31888/m.95225 type:complete len:92 (-) Transcript_31888:80-355(-)